MTVPTAHKILITTAIAFFLLYALWQLSHYARSGDVLDLAWSFAATLAAIGLAVYLRRYIRSLERS